MSKYDLFRKRIAPIAFGVAIVLMARQSCDKHTQTHADVVFDFGAADVRAVHAELWSPTDQLATFDRSALDGHAIGKVELAHAPLPDGDAELRVDVTLPRGQRHAVRHLHGDDGATILVKLADDLK
ncbi:MAG TPA: hypothetical protein VLX92_32915 [Kofleriaceae bacterium]|nr:hypothetical protein [Kofleriaceae bacterium]